MTVEVRRPEPTAETFRTSDGRQADLFNSGHYPMQAVGRVCSEPIQADEAAVPLVQDGPGGQVAVGNLCRENMQDRRRLACVCPAVESLRAWAIGIVRRLK